MFTGLFLGSEREAPRPPSCSQLRRKMYNCPRATKGADKRGEERDERRRSTRDSKVREDSLRGDVCVSARADEGSSDVSSSAFAAEQRFGLASSSCRFVLLMYERRDNKQTKKKTLFDQRGESWRVSPSLPFRHLRLAAVGDFATDFCSFFRRRRVLSLASRPKSNIP